MQVYLSEEPGGHRAEVTTGPVASATERTVYITARHATVAAALWEARIWMRRQNQTISGKLPENR